MSLKHCCGREAIEIWHLALDSSEWGYLVYSLVCLVFSLDPEQKDILIEVIEKLLADKTTVGILQMYMLVTVS